MNSIKAKLTPNAVGIVLSGSQSDILSLYDSISEGIPIDLIEDEDEKIGFLLALCYDLRKAALGSREEILEINPIDPKKSDACDVSHSYGVKVVLPILIAQLNILEGLKEDFEGEVDSYLLVKNFIEVVLDAIKEQSEDVYDYVENWIESNEFGPEYLFNVLVHTTAVEYIEHKPEKTRLDMLPKVLADFDELSDRYREGKHEALAFSKQNNISVYDVASKNTDEIFEKLENDEIKW